MIMLSHSFIVANKYTGVIIGCVLGGLTLIGVVIISVFSLLKKPFRAITPENEPVDNAIRSTAEPVTMTALPGTIQTDIFDMDLPPSDIKANRLPPLNVSLQPGEKANSFILK